MSYHGLHIEIIILSTNRIQMHLYKFECNEQLKWIILESIFEKNVHYFYDPTILSDFFFVFIISKLESMYTKFE